MLNSSLLNKISSQKGESISETLVSLLISALALVMLAGAITSASRIVTGSRQKLEKYYEANEVMAVMPDKISEDISDSVMINNTSGDHVYIKSNDPASSAEGIDVYIYRNISFSDKPVSGYRRTVK